MKETETYKNDNVYRQMTHAVVVLRSPVGSGSGTGCDCEEATYEEILNMFNNNQ